MASKSSTQRAEATRQRLLEASGDLLFEEGPKALSTVRIARRAGIVQSGFYKHFPSVDACVVERVEQLAGALSGFGLSEIERFHESETLDTDELAEILERFLDRCLQNRQLLVLTARHRHAQSPVGEALRRIIEDSVKRYAATLWSLMQRFNVERSHREATNLLARTLFDLALSAGHDVVSGHHAPKRSMAKVLARTVTGAVVAEISAALGIEVSAAHRVLEAMHGGDGDRRTAAAVR